MRVDLSQRLTFSLENAVTNLHPDLVLWSYSCRCVFMLEQMVPWEKAIDKAYERKKLRYANLATEAVDQGWRIRVRPVGVGSKGFITSSTARLLKKVGIRGEAQRKTTDKKSSH